MVSCALHCAAEYATYCVMCGQADYPGMIAYGFVFLGTVGDAETIRMELDNDDDLDHDGDGEAMKKAKKDRKDRKEWRKEKKMRRRKVTNMITFPKKKLSKRREPRI